MYKPTSIKEQKLESIFKKYGVLLPETTPEPWINEGAYGKFESIEVNNIFKGRKPWEFERDSLNLQKIDVLQRLVEKYTKKKFPKGLSYDLFRSFLLFDFNITKVSKDDMNKIADTFTTVMEMTAKMWVGFIPQVKNEVYNRDIKKAETFLEETWKEIQKLKSKQY